MDFSPGFHLLLGPNAQGKTNILEAIYLIATLRSFRGVGSAQMVRHGHKGYFVGAEIEGQSSSMVKIYWSARERNLTLNSQPVRRLADYLGILRAVVFCSEDLQLVKGPASRRRRFVDLLLTQTHPAYLGMLRRYAQALRARNALLKQRVLNEAALAGFTSELESAGSEIIRMRAKLIPEFVPFAVAAYLKITGAREEFSVSYQPAVKADFAVELAQSRSRERTMRMTLVGPHRDEVVIAVDGKSALQFASEGQKRSAVIALKMAQAEYLSHLHGSPPVLLIDDVMGELDRGRRAGLLPLLERAHACRGQVFMTATDENWPRELGRELKRWEVSSGELRTAL